MFVSGVLFRSEPLSVFGIGFNGCLLSVGHFEHLLFCSVFGFACLFFCLCSCSGGFCSVLGEEMALCFVHACVWILCFVCVLLLEVEAD